MIVITAAWLRRKGACELERELFSRLFGKRLAFTGPQIGRILRLRSISSYHSTWLADRILTNKARTIYDNSITLAVQREGEPYLYFGRRQSTVQVNAFIELISDKNNLTRTAQEELWREPKKKKARSKRGRK